jgi:hypothetical protein
MYRQSGGSLQVTEAGLALPIYDYVLNTTPGTDTMTLVFRRGGSGGAIVAHVTIVFTDTSHTDLISVASTTP